jgi:hypothetical protein
MTGAVLRSTRAGGTLACHYAILSSRAAYRALARSTGPGRAGVFLPTRDALRQ